MTVTLSIYYYDGGWFMTPIAKSALATNTYPLLDEGEEANGSDVSVYGSAQCAGQTIQRACFSIGYRCLSNILKMRWRLHPVT